jgi:hypothetical protein
MLNPPTKRHCLQAQASPQRQHGSGGPITCRIPLELHAPRYFLYVRQLTIGSHSQRSCQDCPAQPGRQTPDRALIVTGPWCMPCGGPGCCRPQGTAAALHGSSGCGHTQLPQHAAEPTTLPSRQVRPGGPSPCVRGRRRCRRACQAAPWAGRPPPCARCDPANMQRQATRPPRGAAAPQPLPPTRCSMRLPCGVPRSEGR